MLATAGGQASTWLLVIVPVGSLASGAVIAYSSLYTHIRDRRRDSEIRERREERLDKTADAVLGVEADRTRGVRAAEGLVDIAARHGADIARIAASIGNPNGSGRTLIQELIDARRLVDSVGSGQMVLAQRVEEHSETDARQFAALATHLATIEEQVRRRP